MVQEKSHSLGKAPLLFWAQHHASQQRWAQLTFPGGCKARGPDRQPVGAKPLGLP